MELRLVTPNELRVMVGASLELEPQIPDGIAEFLRAELTARGHCSRRALIQRVFDMVTPWSSVGLEVVQSVLAEITARGDVVEGPGGMRAAAPLRAVDVGSGRFRVFGAIPSRVLFDLDQSAGGSRGVDRVMLFPDAERAREVIASVSGTVLTPERWAGLDRVPVADDSWLDDLDRRLERSGEIAGAREEDITSGWRAYAPDGEAERRQRWKGGALPSASLWRAKHQRGWTVYAWTAGGSPRENRSLRITGDESARSMYALDRRSGQVSRIVGRATGEHVEFECDLFLPRAEYRYVVTMADRVRGASEPPTYRCTRMAWANLSETLESRLGVCVETAEEVPV